ncbi:hypothetical protein ACGLQQ_001191 [Vibrio vulnificus]
MERLINELHFIKSPNPIETVEVNIDSIPKKYGDYTEALTEILDPLAKSDPDLRATVYVYQSPFANFMHSSSSVFIGVVGSKNALELILNGFQALSGVEARYGDSILIKQSTRRLHIEDGLVWHVGDDVTWFASSSIDDIEDDIEEYDDDCDHSYEQDFSQYPSKTKIYEAGDLLKDSVNIEDSEIGKFGNTKELITSSSKAFYSRHRAVRSDARVGSIRATIEDVFGLPEGSVKLCDPEGNPLRADARIGTLRRRWDRG